MIGGGVGMGEIVQLRVGGKFVGVVVLVLVTIG